MIEAIGGLQARFARQFRMGPVNQIKPNLYILSIGINAYIGRSWMPPGKTETLSFPPLGLAVNDAARFGADMKRAGAGLYKEVRLTTMPDKQATRENLDKVIGQLAEEIRPRDTFILFAAAHGRSDNGRFYLIPQDYKGGTNPASLAERAIDQSRLQDWLANRIKAKKAIILLDTCDYESGALVGGYSRSRTDVPASEAALGRLHEATGRPVLTAAAEGNPAFEGLKVTACSRGPCLMHCAMVSQRQWHHRAVRARRARARPGAQAQREAERLGTCGNRWDAATGQLLRTFGADADHSEKVKSVCRPASPT